MFWRKPHWVVLRKLFCSWCISLLCFISSVIVLFNWNGGLSNVNHPLGCRRKQMQRECHRGLPVHGVLPRSRAWGQKEQMKRALMMEPHPICVCPRPSCTFFYPSSLSFNASFCESDPETGLSKSYWGFPKLSKELGGRKKRKKETLGDIKMDRKWRKVFTGRYLTSESASQINHQRFKMLSR